MKFSLAIAGESQGQELHISIFMTLVGMLPSNSQRHHQELHRRTASRGRLESSGSSVLTKSMPNQTLARQCPDELAAGLLDAGCDGASKQPTTSSCTQLTLGLNRRSTRAHAKNSTQVLPVLQVHPGLINGPVCEQSLAQILRSKLHS